MPFYLTLGIKATAIILALLICAGWAVYKIKNWLILKIAIHRLTNHKNQNKKSMYKFTLKPQGAPADQDPVTFLAVDESSARLNFQLLQGSANPEKPVEIAIVNPSGETIEHAVLRPKH